MKVIICSLLLLGIAYCQNEIPEDVRELEKRLNELPGFEHFDQSNVTAVTDALRLKCEKYGGSEAFDKLDAAKEQLIQCVQSNFNFTQIQEEIDKSRKTGSMDEVFAKYCLKTPIVEKCVMNLTETIKPCLAEEEKSSLKLLLNITDSLANFVCYKDGDRIAMFVAEGGFECIQKKQVELEQCANKTLGHLIPKDLSLTNLPLLVVNEKGCDDYVNLQACVVSVLETCEDNTPANIIDALFKYVRRITPCKNHPVATSALGVHRRLLRSPTDQPGVGGLNTAFNGLLEKFEPHCLKNGGPKAAEEFRIALQQMRNCSNSTQTSLKQKIRETGALHIPYLCNDFRNGLRFCLTGLAKKMEACTSREEAYVPAFGVEIYDSIFGYYCKDDGKVVKGFLSGQDACLKTVQDSSGECISRTKHIKLYGSASEIVTKYDFCGDIQTLKQCFLDISAQRCTYQDRESVFGFTDALYAPCAKCNSRDECNGFISNPPKNVRPNYTVGSSNKPGSGCKFVIFDSLIVLLFIVVKNM